MNGGCVHIPTEFAIADAPTTIPTEIFVQSRGGGCRQVIIFSVLNTNHDLLLYITSLLIYKPFSYTENLIPCIEIFSNQNERHIFKL